MRYAIVILFALFAIAVVAILTFHALEAGGY